jgi:hypothetical protein
MPRWAGEAGFPRAPMILTSGSQETGNGCPVADGGYPWIKLRRISLRVRRIPRSPDRNCFNLGNRPYKVPKPAHAGHG